MDRAFRKRIMRTIIANADAIMILTQHGAFPLASFPIRTVIHMMRLSLGAGGANAVAGVMPKKQRTLPTIHAPGVH